MHERITVLDFFPYHDGRLACRQFLRGNRFRTMPPCKDGLTRCPQIAHPIHDSEWGPYIAHATMLNNRERNSTWLSTFASAHREKVHRVVSYDKTWTDKRYARS